MKKLIITIAYISLLIALFFAVKESIDPVTWRNASEFFFGDYVRLYEVHIKDSLPPITHPVVLILIALFVLGFFRANKKE